MQRSLGAAGTIAAPNSACRSSVDERPSAYTFSAAWQRLLPNEISGFWRLVPPLGRARTNAIGSSNFVELPI